jgi:hypothetical protein
VPRRDAAAPAVLVGVMQDDRHRIAPITQQPLPKRERILIVCRVSF